MASRPCPAGRDAPAALSVLVVVHRMPAQAERTLRSLGAPYQQDVAPGEVEVICVENASDRPLGEARARAALPRLRYVARDWPLRSPVPAVHHGAGPARGRRQGQPRPLPAPAETPGTPLVPLFGEGPFHQVHGGVATDAPPDAAPILFGAVWPFRRRSLAQDPG